MDLVDHGLLQYGAVGILAVVGALVSRMLFERWSKAQAAEVERMVQALDRETKRADRLESELGRLNEAVRGGYVDAITRATQATTEAANAVALALATVRRS